jgi:hypothetical protein
MSVILNGNSAQISFTSTGTQPILAAANYVISDIAIILSNFFLSTGSTSFDFDFVLQASPTLDNIQEVIFGQSGLTTGTQFDANQIIQRSFPSSLILPRGNSIVLDCKEFTGLTLVNITLNITGFTY